METPITYQTRSDFIAREITPALDEYADDFDLDAVFDEMAVWHDEKDADGNIWVNASGYRVREEFIDNPDAFWELVQKHETN